MKLTDDQKIQLFGQILCALIPKGPKTTPPPKGGKAKPASMQFAAACWAKRYLDSAVYVLEHEGEQRTVSDPGQPVVDDTPF